MLEYTGERQVKPNFSEINLDHRQRYEFASSMVKEGDKIADVGCGVGYGSYYLASMTPCESVVGIDISQEAVDYADMFYGVRNPKVRYLRQDIIHEHIEGTYQLITAFEVIEHIDTPEEFLKAICSMLSLNGIAVFSTPNQDVLPYHAEIFPYHKRHYTVEEFLELLEKSGFTVLMQGSQNGRSVYSFPGNCYNVFTCRRSDGTGRIEENIAIKDDLFGRAMASYEKLAYCVDNMPWSDTNQLYQSWNPPMLTEEKILEQVKRNLDFSRRIYQPDYFGDHPCFSQTVGVLKPGDRISLRFKARNDNLYQIALRASTYTGSFWGKLCFYLYDENHRCLASSVCDVEENHNQGTDQVRDGELLPFAFDTQAYSAGKVYQMDLEVISIGKNVKFSVYCDDTDHTEGFVINGAEVMMALCYRLYYL